MDLDVEKSSIDVSQNARIFYDATGDTYVTEKDEVLICEQGVRLKAFEVGKVNRAGDESLYFKYDKGHRFDHINHNWILFNEYLSLSFSFMTLVIRDQMQNSGNYLDPDFTFDLEQYNFVINRRTCFTCDNFVGENYDKLVYVLKELEEIDPVYLH